MGSREHIFLTEKMLPFQTGSDKLWFLFRLMESLFSDSLHRTTAVIKTVGDLGLLD